MIHAKELEQSLHKEAWQLWSPVHGLFRTHEGFMHAKSQTLTKEFVLQTVGPGPTGANHLRTQAMYKDNQPEPRVGVPNLAIPPNAELLHSASDHVASETNAKDPVTEVPHESSFASDPTHALSPTVYRTVGDQCGDGTSVVPGYLDSNNSALSPAVNPDAKDVSPGNVLANHVTQVMQPTESRHAENKEYPKKIPYVADTMDHQTQHGTAPALSPFFQAKPLPRLGCGGPTHNMDAVCHEGKAGEPNLHSKDSAHALRPAVYREEPTASSRSPEIDNSDQPRFAQEGWMVPQSISHTGDNADQPRPTQERWMTSPPISHTGMPEALPMAVYRNLGDAHQDDFTRNLHANEASSSCRNLNTVADPMHAAIHDPPTLFQAKPLPRLGCGGPSPFGDSHVTATELDSNQDDENTELSGEARNDHAAKRHCTGPRDDTCSHGHVGQLIKQEDMQSQEVDLDPEESTNVHQPEGTHSPITVGSETPTIPDSIQLQPVLKGSIHWQQYHEIFWFAADIPGTHLERVWELGPCCTFSDWQETTIASLDPTKAKLQDETSVALPRNCAQVLIDDELTLLKVEPQVPLLEQQHIQTLSGVLYDQFGPLSAGQTTDYGTLLFMEPLTHGVNSRELVFVLAAFTQTSMTWHVCKQTNQIYASFDGPKPAVDFMCQFFSFALTAHSLNMLGRKAEKNNNGDLTFRPTRENGVAPPNSFLIAISIAAARTLLDSLETDEHQEPARLVTLKWAGRPVWHGKLLSSTNLGTIECILRYCFAPWGFTTAFRMIRQGQQVPMEMNIASLPGDPKRKDLLIHAVMAIRGGGQGTKMQQRAVQQNALASTLLDHGFNLAWTTKTVDTIMDKYGLGKLQTINAQPMGGAKIQAILQLCKDAGITIPDLGKSKSGNELPGSASQKRKKRALDFKLNPADYTLVDGFFTKEDGSTLAQVNQIVPQASGICIQTPSQAEVWVREGQKISADELGVLVVGPINVHSALVSEEVTFPCLNNDHQMVLINATMIQLGAKAIQHKQGDPKQVPSETCSLVAVTMYREDWQEDDWRSITTNPVTFVRKQLESEGLSMGIQAVWGKSLRHNRSPATPIQAMTVQVHMTVEDAMMERLLIRSGFNRLFLTPKTQVGRLNPAYKVIWIPGDVPKITSLSTKCQACVGLVRGRQGKGYGLRFHQDKYDAAWAVLMPGVTPPQNTPGDKVYKLQNLPFGCTKLMLQNWVETMKWDACPIRALGPQTWLVRAEADIPEGISMFNSNPILARLLPPRDQQGPEKILLGPRPKPQATAHADPGHLELGQDPWANYGPHKGVSKTTSSAMPPQQGPTEKRFLEQDAKIATMQASIDQLTQAQAVHTKHVESQLKQAAQREQDNLCKMDKALKHIEHTVDTALTKSMHHYQATMDEKFQELKHLFMNNKRSAPADAEDMDD